MPSPYLTRRLRSFEEANAAQDRESGDKAEINSCWQPSSPPFGGNRGELENRTQQTA